MLTRSVFTYVLLSTALAMGCGGNAGTDAAVPTDGSRPRDAGRTDGDVADAFVRTDAGTDAGVPPLSVEGFKDALAEELCRIFIECEAKMGLAIAALESVACHPLGADTYYDAIDVAIAAGTVTYDEDAARACLAEVQGTVCADLFSMFEEPLNALCAEAFVPTVAPGDDCGRTAECIDGTCSISNTCPGSCTAHGDADAPCALDSDCIESLACRPVGSTLTRTCQTPAGLSDGCNTDRGCAGALVCLDGECNARGAEDAPCNENVDCADAMVCVVAVGGPGTCQIGAAEDDACGDGNPCAAGLRCHPTSDVCVALAAPGGACGANEQCPLGFWCDGGSCTPLPAAGGSCVLTPDSLCATGICVAGTCQLRNVGQTCRGLFAPFTDCAGDLVCVGGTCAEPLALGAMGCGVGSAACGPDAACQMGLAGGTSCVPTACAPAP